MTASPATPERTRGFKKKERTRRLLIGAAVAEIASKGEAFTVLDVTKRAEVSNGTFYNYFDDRDALLDAVTAEVLSSFVNTSAEIVDIEDPLRRFATITALVLERNAASPELATVLLRLHSMTQTDSWAADPFRHLRSDLAEAAASGRLQRTPTDATIDLVTGALFRALVRVTTAETPRSYHAELIGLLLETFGLDTDEATSIAADAVNAAPELDRTFSETDPFAVPTTS